MEITPQMIREIQLITAEHYTSGECRPYCCYTVWRKYIFPVYKCSYRAYTQYLKVRYPDHTKYADYLLPKPRQYRAETTVRIRAIYDYRQKHYPLAGRRERTIKSIWRDFVKAHFDIHYSGFLVYSRINPADIEDAQADEPDTR